MTIQDQRDEWVAYLDRHGPDEMPLSMQESIPMLTRVLSLVDAADAVVRDGTIGMEGIMIEPSKFATFVTSIADMKRAGDIE